MVSSTAGWPRSTVCRGSQARKVLDASGLIVAPGFVDLHTHYDAQLFWDPYCTISGWHGITSVVIGNCGFGFAPCRPEDRERSMLSLTRNEQISYEAMQEGLPWDWESFPDFLDSVERTPKGVNVISYAPLSPIIAWAMGGYDARQGSLAECRRVEIDTAASSTRRWTPGRVAGRSSGSARTRRSLISMAHR